MVSKLALHPIGLEFDPLLGQVIILLLIKICATKHKCRSFLGYYFSDIGHSCPEKRSRKSIFCLIEDQLR